MFLTGHAAAASTLDASRTLRAALPWRMSCEAELLERASRSREALSAFMAASAHRASDALRWPEQARAEAVVLDAGMGATLRRANSYAVAAWPSGRFWFAVQLFSRRGRSTTSSCQAAHHEMLACGMARCVGVGMDGSALTSYEATSKNARVASQPALPASAPG